MNDIFIGFERSEVFVGDGRGEEISWEVGSKGTQNQTLIFPDHLFISTLIYVNHDVEIRVTGPEFDKNLLFHHKFKRINVNSVMTLHERGI